MSLLLTAPSKTFLLGEYTALTGGPALILCTAPRFTLHATSKAGGPLIHEGIHAESPAGRLIARESSFYQNYALRFDDPYHGLGGLGASSAQFVMTFALQYAANAMTDQDVESAVNQYQQLARGVGVAPSGADVVAQFKGSLCFFYKTKSIIKTFSWPFPDVLFCFIHTGKKIATHEHLQKIQWVDYDDLMRIVLEGVESLDDHDSAKLAEAIKKYAHALQMKNLVAPYTQAWLKKINVQSGVLAAKGCGAMGADIILVLLRKAEKDVFLQWTQQQRLNVVYIGNEIDTGLVTR